MSESHQSKGNCAYCGHSFKKAGMTRHLKSCSKRTDQISKTDSKSKNRINIFHLMIQGAFGGDYWLHLEMSDKAKLKELDHYLRVIWLECCGHLSQFSYEKWGHKISMNSSVDRVLAPGNEIYHIYDFGDSSETKIKVVGVRKGIMHTKNPIFLMSRNDPPQYLCQACGEKATWLCIECLYDNNDGTLCDRHVQSYPHDEYGEAIEIINSPRLGMCGYVGPADPPY
jgi:hypothetical protein